MAGTAATASSRLAHGQQRRSRLGVGLPGFAAAYRALRVGEADRQQRGQHSLWPSNGPGACGHRRLRRSRRSRRELLALPLVKLALGNASSDPSQPMRRSETRTAGPRSGGRRAALRSCVWPQVSLQHRPSFRGQRAHPSQWHLPRSPLVFQPGRRQPPSLPRGRRAGGHPSPRPPCRPGLAELHSARELRLAPVSSTSAAARPTST